MCVCLCIVTIIKIPHLGDRDKINTVSLLRIKENREQNTKRLLPTAVLDIHLRKTEETIG